jgi:BASS family bile acid:Na+ symporter
MNPAKIVAIIALISLTFGAGLDVNLERLIAVLKNVSLLVRALLANFVIVPLLGVLIAKLFRLPPLVASGFLLMAIAPGVPFVLLGVRKKGGRLGLAVELAVLLPLISLVTVPLTAELVLPTQISGELPLGQFVVTLLLFQVLPLLIGIVVGDRAPSIAPRLARISQLVFFATILVVLILLAPKFANSVALVYGSHGMLAILCLTLLSMATGWLLGGPAHEDQRILGIGTTLRNIGLCLVISTANFREPLLTATVLTYLLIQIIISSIFGRIFMQRAKQEAAA